MPRRRSETLPAGRDEVVAAGGVRHGMWMIDPVTGEWARVKEFRHPGFACTGFGGQSRSKVTLSLWRLGQREVEVDALVTVRVSDPPKLTTSMRSLYRVPVVNRRHETLPDGHDKVVTADEVRHGMWMIDPQTGEWAQVKQFHRRRRSSETHRFGETKAFISLRRAGGRELDLSDPVTIRVRPQPQASCAFGC